MDVRLFSPDDEVALQSLLASHPVYTERITGYPPGPSDALSLLISRPESVAEADKIVVGGWEGGNLVGVIDIIRGYPDAARAFIGLLLVAPSARRRGFGSELLGWVQRSCKTCDRVRVALIDSVPDAAGFWEHHGFRPTGETRPWRYGPVESVSRIYERSLPL